MKFVGSLNNTLVSSSASFSEETLSNTYVANNVNNRLLKKPIFSVLNNHLIDYPTPVNISYWWGYGSLAGIFLVVQLVTGIFLAMHYTPHIDLAFFSVEHIMRDVNGGWLLRYLHANGASFFFLAVYIHMFRGLYYGSYAFPRAMTWCLGVVIIILMMATAFMGYVLPWGQMSFWAATVITNLFSAFPYVGESIVTLLWGGFSVDNATLNRFFSLHYLLPFAIAAVAVVHIAVLHIEGSNNPLGVNGSVDKIGFYPYLWVKDVLGWVFFGFIYSIFVFFYPNYLGHPDNYIEANPMVTPAHIVPEWYFLPYYAILRSIPDKLGGVIAMFGSLVVLFLLPWLNTSEIRSSAFRPIHRKFFWLLVVDCFILGWIGGEAPETPYLEIGQLATLYYFVYFLLIIPFLGFFEKMLLSVPKSNNV
uniref:Cytochrome b n=1 Tax=Palpitomonas bilix TaxID=652834 RepID=A0A1E1GHP5_9EUKA|nr:apocytochrome b [Palpitomonas bilix]YP_009317265.1 apocytochrome b [Palpitomonas bilix]BAV82388.1 apocytochrome b [Palpitomonas bilix]BAV82433.1 apocytochrome b [Palpitomonas bilix]